MPPPRRTEPGRASRQDERGIALQTVIIMVVLLAVAGGIAGVLLTRGGEATSQLEAQDATVSAYRYEHRALCEAAGHEWETRVSGPLRRAHNPGLRAAGLTNIGTAIRTNGGYCHPS